MDARTTNLATLEYPGRLIAVGRVAGGGKAVIVYAITGRSPSSQARKLVFRDAGIWVQPTDEEVLKKGNVDLLVYPAALFAERGIAVSNGKQTGDVLDRLSAGGNPVAVLSAALERWDYEPDAPIYTPRISGCLCGGKAGLSLVRRGPDGTTLRSYFEAPLSGPGRAWLVSTYQGPNRDPLPPFEGEPREIVLTGATARETAGAVYEALAPQEGRPDFRVAVAAVHASLDDPADLEFHITNRQERT
jgi:IMP cyclohydrolase